MSTGAAALLAPGLTVSIIRGSSRDIPLLVEEIEIDGNGFEVSRVPVDLDATAAELCWVLVDPCGGPELARKTSAAAGIIILDQTDPATIGRATIVIEAADTNRQPKRYRHEAWVELANGDRGVLIAPSDFIILPAAKLPGAAAPPPPEGEAAPQTPVERSFSFSWPALGGTAAVVIPGGMLRDTYHVDASFDGVPILAGQFAFENKTADGFDAVVLGGALTAGTALTFYIRDHS